MSDEKKSGDSHFVRRVGEQEVRKLRAQRHVTETVWSGLGMMGLVGWSVVVPTVLGAALGIWLDEHHHGAHSWTLSLLIIGLTLGCLNAWHWVTKEEREIHAERKIKDE